jgi:alpha-N-arabinofuranosidase
MKRIASGPDGNKPKERVEWTKQFFEDLGHFRRPPIDGYDLHFYNWNLDSIEQKETVFNESEWDKVIESCFELEDVIREQAELIRAGIDALPDEDGFFKTPKPTCDLIVGEWGNWHGSAFTNRPALYQQCTMRDAITTALTLDIFHRNCDSVKMACVAQTVNVLNSLILTDGEACIRTPNYDVFKMYMVHREAEALDVESAKEEKVYSFASEKDGQIYVNLVNANMKNDVEVPLTFSENVEFISGNALESADPHDCNTKEEPDKIRMKKSDVPSGTQREYLVKMKAASIQVLHFQIKN